MPCYNEADNVEAMHDAVAEAFADCGFAYELVFVDDGSRDGTYQKLKALHARSAQNIRVVRFSRNFGKESAIYAGLKHAKGDLVTIIDADLQQPPSWPWKWRASWMRTTSSTAWRPFRRSAARAGPSPS